MNKSLFLLAILFVGLLYVLPMQVPEVKGEETSSTTGSIVDALDWSQFWQKFNSYAAWDLEWYDDSSWISVKSDLQIVRDYPQEDICKMTLIFDASQTGNYRLTFGIDARVREYIEKLGQYQYLLTYDKFEVIFDWSDVIGIPNLQITHGIKNVEGIDYFWFRMRKDNINQGSHLEIDPSVQVEHVYYEASPSFQRRNFRANGYFWQFYVDEWDYDFCYESSADGETWGNKVAIYGGGDPYVESIRATEVGIYLETNTLVHMVYANYNSEGESGSRHSIFYRTGTLGEGTISLGTQYTVCSEIDGFNAPTVTVDSNGYPWVGYSIDDAGYYVKKATATSGATWGSATLIFSPDACSFFYNAGVILPLDSGKMYVIWENNHPGDDSGDGALGRLYDGSWEANQTIWMRDDLSESHHNKMRYSVVVKNNYDIIYFRDARYVQTNGDVNNNGTWVYEYDYSGDSWSRIKQVSTGGTVGFVTINKTTEDMWFFYTHTNAGSEDFGDGIYYVRYTDSTTTWGDEVTVDATVTGLNHLHGFYEQRDGHLGVAYVDASWLYFIAVSENIAPTNEGVTITNMDDTNYLYPQKRDYLFQALYNDADATGSELYHELDFVMIAFTDGTNWINASFQMPEESWALQSGSSVATIVSGSCSNSTSGNQLTTTFAIRLQWDIQDALNIELYQWCNDTSNAIDSWEEKQTNYANIESDLQTSFSIDDDRGDISQSITASGTVTYEGSPAYPPGIEFTSVSVYDSGDNNEGTDSTIINGAWTVTFNAPSTAGIDTYNLYINMIDADYTDAEETAHTDTFITGGLKLTGLTSPSFLGNGQYQYQIQITYAYDDSPIDGGVARVKHANGTELTTDFIANSTGWATIVLSQSNSSAGTFTLYGYSEPTYGITDKHTNQTFIIYTLNLQARDADGTNLPRSVTYGITVSSMDFGDQTSSAAGLETIYVPSETYVVNTLWEDHLVDSAESVVVSGTTTANIDTKIKRQSDGTKYILFSINQTTIPAISYISKTELRLPAVTATGSIEMKLDNLNWVETGQPYRIKYGTYEKNRGSANWDWLDNVLTVPISFSTLDITVYWTEEPPPPPGPPSPGPGPIIIPAEPEEPEEEEKPTISVEPILPSPVDVSVRPSADMTPWGVAIIVAVVAVGLLSKQLKKQSLAGLWQLRKQKRKKAKFPKRKKRKQTSFKRKNR